MKIFGERLRSLRIARGITQQEMADLLFMDRTTILGWELRGKEPDFEVVVDIADILDVSIDYLFGRDEFCRKSHKMSNFDDENYLSPLHEQSIIKDVP